MNLMLYELVYAECKDYIIKHSKINVTVLKKPATKIFPRITIQEISNIALKNLGKMESYSLIGFEVNIYAKDLELDGQTIDSMEAARYFSGIVSKYMDDIAGFNRELCKHTPYLDNKDVYRITMRYTGKSSDYRGHFFK